MSSLHEEIHARVLRWAEHISEQAPAGEFARYAPAYETVALEVARLECPTSGPVAWTDVLREAGALLREKTKDLWLASWLGYGLYATEGPLGAATGAALLAELMERYWPALFPEITRVKARARAVDWFVERIARALPLISPEPAQREAFVALDQASQHLADVCRQHLLQHSPDFSRLFKALRQACALMAPPTAGAGAAPDAAPPSPSSPDPRPPAPAPSPGAAPTPASPAATAAAGLPPVEELRDTGAAIDYLQSTGGTLLSAASAIRRANSADPLAYRILRTGLWLHLEQPPSPAPGGLTTTVPPLPAALRGRLELLLDKGRWPEALEESECALSNFRFALDLQRFSAAALAGLGAPHADALAALAREVAALLERMPRLPELLASDGTPLADARTRAWLAAGPRHTPPSASLGIAAPTRDLPEPGSPAPACSGGLQDTLGRLQDAVASARTGRDRFLARLELARLCASSGQRSLACGLYELLDQDSASISLDDWEPSLAVALLTGWLNMKHPIRNSVENPPAPVRNRLRRLIRLDPAAALPLQGGLDKQ